MWVDVSPLKTVEPEDTDEPIIWDVFMVNLAFLRANISPLAGLITLARPHKARDPRGLTF